MKKLDNINRGNVLISTIHSKVSENFDKIATLLFRYITIYFNHMSYEYNLYIYNYIIEAVKVNIELLDKISDKEEVVFN